jgi:plastocyanin domain-containing protein
MWIINIVGVLLIALIVWWFWLYKPNETSASKDLVIDVENGVYTPAHIKLAANQATDIVFNRKDPAPCAEMLQVPAFDISETLALNKQTRIHLPAMPAGEYDFHCQMQMYKGKIHVQ